MPTDPESLAYRLSIYRPTLHKLPDKEAQQFLATHLSPEELLMMDQSAINFQANSSPSNSDEN